MNSPMLNPGLSKNTRKVLRKILRNFLSSRDWMGKKYWLAKIHATVTQKRSANGEGTGKALHAPVELEGHGDDDGVDRQGRRARSRLEP